MENLTMSQRYAMPPIDRAKILNEFKIFCNIVCEEPPTKEQALEVARIQYEYYKEHPKHAFCPIKRFAHVVKPNMKKGLTIFESEVLKVLDMHMGR